MARIDHEPAIRASVAPCELGLALVASSDRGICAILLGDDPDTLARDLRARWPSAVSLSGDGGIDAHVAQVVELIDGRRLDVDLPLNVRGTDFQRRVWDALRAIPWGQTASYSQVARRIGAPTAARAVAGACAANLLAVAIPCHRVVRGDGELSGYRWGAHRKRALLAREAGYALSA